MFPLLLEVLAIEVEQIIQFYNIQLKLIDKSARWQMVLDNLTI